MSTTEEVNTVHICSDHIDSLPQMTFVPGRHGHHVPEAVVQAPCHGAGCVCVRMVEIQLVPLRSRLRETERRPSCVTNSPVQVEALTNPKSVTVSCVQLVSQIAGKLR